MSLNDTQWKSFPTTSLIGFDDIIRRIKEIEKPQSSYPPYNIIRLSNTETLLELAVAGFSKENISVVLEDNKLTVSGSGESLGDSDVDYIHKGIAERNFTRVFTLADSVEVSSVKFVNGLVKIFLKTIIPEHKKPKVFTIE